MSTNCISLDGICFWLLVRTLTLHKKWSVNHTRMCMVLTSNIIDDGVQREEVDGNVPMLICSTLSFSCLKLAKQRNIHLDMQTFVCRKLWFTNKNDSQRDNFHSWWLPFLFIIANLLLTFLTLTRNNSFNSDGLHFKLFNM